MKRLFLLAAVLFLAITGVFLWIYQHNNKPNYITAKVERGDIIQQVVATGVVNAVTTVQVGSQVSGRIIKLYADYNSIVKKGDLIAELDPSLFQAQVNQASGNLENAKAAVGVQNANVQASFANLENVKLGIESAKALVASAKAEVSRLTTLKEDAKRNMDRNEELLRRNLIAKSDRDTSRTSYDAIIAQIEGAMAQSTASQQKLLQAKSQHNTAKAQYIAAEAQVKAAQAQVMQASAALEIAETNLRYTKIYAPVNGIVIARNVDEGQTVAASLQAPILFLIAEDLTKMKVDANIDEADVGRIEEGMLSEFTVDAYPEETFQGKVIQVRNNPTTVQNVVTYNSVIEVSNPDLKLKPGMTANLSILIKRKDSVLKLPNAALRFRLPEKRKEYSAAANGAAPKNANNIRQQDKQQHEKQFGGRIRKKDTKVWILSTSGIPQERAVILGINNGLFTEIQNGDLQEGDQVITGVEEKRKNKNGTQRIPAMPGRRF